MLKHVILAVSFFALTACSLPAKRVDAPTTALAAPATSRVIEVKNLREIDVALSATTGKRVLLVLDIDDTLLTSLKFFGSDKWYEHQKTLPAGDPGLVKCRFDVIAMNYEAGTQVATEPADVSYINELAVDRILLTSRSWLYRGATVREYQNAGYVLPPMLGDAEPGVIFRWRADSADREATVSYDQGLFMTTGQDKGKILVHLLKERGLAYDEVILVDDGRRNIDAMQAALAKEDIGYQGLWYTRIDKTVSTQEANDGVAGWLAWRSMLTNTFPERLQRLDANQCAY